VDLDALLAQPALAHGYWGVLVRSLKTDETLYAVNANKLMLPASNMKIVTLAAAAEKLGWDYSYETRLVAAGSIVNGTLEGDLVVIGSGDPSLMDAGEDGTPPFDAWIAALKQRGVHWITGRILGDDSKFESQGLGFGWSWDDLVGDYAAATSALQFNENAVRVTLTPAAAPRLRADVQLSPATNELQISNNVLTGEPESAASVSAYRLPGSSSLMLQGSLPAGGKPVVRAVSVDNPTRFFVNSLRAALVAGGIGVVGPAGCLYCFHLAPDLAHVTPIASLRSAPLSTLAVRMMKISQNLYAETLLETLSGTTPATAAGGRSVVQSVFTGWGVADGEIVQRDGSGLTRYDFVTPDALVKILAHVDRDARLRDPFEASLPIAGRDGTLANRMKGTPAEGNARAKTGSMTSVRGTSGYVTSADGEPLIFAILVNNFEVPGSVITKTEDDIIVRLATFRR
jgi:D-alanyl-D-alanine carboxypeptidase/D-alanyl-D-alanine-endopeptidase (penicillin-binding protein 4)